MPVARRPTASIFCACRSSFSSRLCSLRSRRDRGDTDHLAVADQHAGVHVDRDFAPLRGSSSERNVAWSAVGAFVDQPLDVHRGSRCHDPVRIEHRAARRGGSRWPVRRRGSASRYGPRSWTIRISLDRSNRSSNRAFSASSRASWRRMVSSSAPRRSAGRDPIARGKGRDEPPPGAR